MAFISLLSTFPFYPSLSTSSSTSNLSFLHLRLLKPTYCLSLKQSNTPETDTHFSQNDALRVAFAAGGTGGHISPAVAIADELKIINPASQFLFVGSPNSMEATAIPSFGFDFVSVPTLVRLFRPLVSLRNLFLPYYIIKSVLLCNSILEDFDPHIVVGTGGYVSFPICLAAVFKGIKVVIQEQNSVPGIANWVLSFLADKVFVAFNSTVECFPRKSNCVVCGNPVRLSVRTFVSKEVAKLKFFPKSGKGEGKVLLILGGSLGANAINIAMLNFYYKMLMEDKLFIIWQTGVESFNEMESLVKNHPHLLLTPLLLCGDGCNDEVKRFIGKDALLGLLLFGNRTMLRGEEHFNDVLFDQSHTLVSPVCDLFLESMDLAYAAADLVVSRAGAMTCSEILATGKPAILIPSPNVAEGHQLKNASLMADVAGSRVITEDELDSITLGTAIEDILGNEGLMADMSERARKAAKPSASAEIAHQILSLIESSAAK
ncbi:hypothetical protein Pint_16543 [Pistacia integerrima]|uniref:Uncharacterized protein n=1 Tax=Pistacia integerrima TaxID=434235 RepID=A0ACC0ZBL0_9ROSI|nr:hypothetical protein Pint_16543 [Pistacia integerrima]